jgi:hypothetical protein
MKNYAINDEDEKSDKEEQNSVIDSSINNCSDSNDYSHNFSN